VKTKHTSGPWVAALGNIHSQSANAIVADVHVRQVGVSDENERFANACLIAAAPEMLEALKSAEVVLGLGGNYEEQDRVRTAIAKATA